MPAGRRRAHVAAGVLTLCALVAWTTAAPAQAPVAEVDAVDIAWSDAGPSIQQGGTVTFAYPTGGDLHNVAFNGATAGVACAQTAGTGAPDTGTTLPSVPRGPGWSVTCTFAQAGQFTFLCVRHPMAMRGAVTVTAAPGPSPGPSPSPTPTPGGPAPTPAPTPGAEAPGPGPAPAPPAGEAPGPPVAVAPTPGLDVARRQHGTRVRGVVTDAGAGTAVAIRLTARRGALGLRSRPGGRAAVGSLRATTRADGRLRFAVRLGPRARGALRRAGRLSLVLRVAVRPAGASPVVRTAPVTLRR